MTQHFAVKNWAVRLELFEKEQNAGRGIPDGVEQGKRATMEATIFGVQRIDDLKRPDRFLEIQLTAEDSMPGLEDCGILLRQIAGEMINAGEGNPLEL